MRPGQAAKGPRQQRLDRWDPHLVISNDCFDSR